MAEIFQDTLPKPKEVVPSTWKFEYLEEPSCRITAIDKENRYLAVQYTSASVDPQHKIIHVDYIFNPGGQILLMRHIPSLFGRAVIEQAGEISRRFHIDSSTMLSVDLEDTKSYGFDARVGLITGIDFTEVSFLVRTHIFRADHQLFWPDFLDVARVKGKNGDVSLNFYRGYHPQAKLMEVISYDPPTWILQDEKRRPVAKLQQTIEGEDVVFTQSSLIKPEIKFDIRAPEMVDIAELVRFAEAKIYIGENGQIVYNWPKVPELLQSISFGISRPQKRTKH